MVLLNVMSYIEGIYERGIIYSKRYQILNRFRYDVSSCYVYLWLSWLMFVSSNQCILCLTLYIATFRQLKVSSWLLHSTFASPPPTLWYEHIKSKHKSVYMYNERSKVRPNRKLIDVISFFGVLTIQVPTWIPKLSFNYTQVCVVIHHTSSPPFKQSSFIYLAYKIAYIQIELLLKQNIHRKLMLQVLSLVTIRMLST